MSWPAPPGERRLSSGLRPLPKGHRLRREGPPVLRSRLRQLLPGPDRSSRAPANSRLTGWIYRLAKLRWVLGSVKASTPAARSLLDPACAPSGPDLRSAPRNGPSGLTTQCFDSISFVERDL